MGRWICIGDDHSGPPQMNEGRMEIDDGRVKSLLMNLLETEPEIEVRLAAERGLVILEEREKAAAGKVSTEFEGQDLVDPLRLDNEVVIEPAPRAERPRRPRPPDRPQ